jgi:hypothetical protein
MWVTTDERPTSRKGGETWGTCNQRGCRNLTPEARGYRISRSLELN